MSKFKSSCFNINISKDGDKYLYNSFSKACVRIIPDKAHTLEEALNADLELPGEAGQFQAQLLKNGFLVKSGTDEVEQLRYMYTRNYFAGSVLNIVLLPTMACNLACPYCFEEGHKEIPLNAGYFPALRAFAEKNFAGKKVVQVSLFGGEPLLKATELLDYLKFCSTLAGKHGVKFLSSIVTNGVLLTEKISEALIDSGCSSLQVTIDGGKQTHDSLRVGKDRSPTFDLILSNFKRAVSIAIAREKKLHFVLRINLYNQTDEAVKGTLESIPSELRPHIEALFRPVYSTKCFNSVNSDTHETLTHYYGLAKKLGYQIQQNTYLLQQCEASGDESFFYITPDLKTWKCLTDMGHDAPCFGRISAGGEHQIDREKLAAWFSNSDPFRDPECLQCGKLPDCYGGCILYKVKNGKRRCKTDALTTLPNIYA